MKKRVETTVRRIAAFLLCICMCAGNVSVYASDGGAVVVEDEFIASETDNVQPEGENDANTPESAENIGGGGNSGR